jgi:hypothetical protein
MKIDYDALWDNIVILSSVAIGIVLAYAVITA